MEIPITFLGIADHVEDGAQPFPLGSLDIFKLSQNKIYIFYPTNTQNNRWIFMVNMDQVIKESNSELKLRIIYEDGDEFTRFSIIFESIELKKYTDEEGIKDYQYVSLEGSKFPVAIIHKQLASVVTKPGNLIIQININNNNYVEIGRVCFHYNLTPQFTKDQVRAIESDPNSKKYVKLNIGCKSCQKTINIYSGIKRSEDIEREGFIWQDDLEDTFKCDCGKVNQKLEFIKESLHGMLLKKDSLPQISELSFVRQYSHSRVINIANKFNNLLSTEKLEEPIQKFIEVNPILFAQFHAKKLFFKTNILGKFKTDFIILDTQNRLLFIEIEKPSLRLFRKNGHPTSYLNHAYEQVRDWLNEYSKHPFAILDYLELNRDQIGFVGGVVIAGRRSQCDSKSLYRHLSNPAYPNIEFYTFEDLANNLMEISRHMA